MVFFVLLPCVVDFTYSYASTQHLLTITRMQEGTAKVELNVISTTLVEDQQQPKTPIDSHRSESSHIQRELRIQDGDPPEEQQAVQATHQTANMNMDDAILKINTLSITFAGVLIALGGIILYFTRTFISSRLRYFLPIPPIGVAAYVFVFNMFKFYNASLPQFSAVVIEILLSTLTAALAYLVLVVLMVLIIWLIL